MFLRVHGDRFVTDDGPILLRGIGLGCHLNLEHFMLGIPGTNFEIRSTFDKVFGEADAKRFWDTYYKNYVSNADFSFLKNLGFNCVRIPIGARAWGDGDSFNASESLAELDRVVGLCGEHEMFAVVDMHAALLPQNPDWHSDNTSGEYAFFKDEAVRKRTARLWGQLASHFKNNPWVGAFDLLNEPCYFEPAIDNLLVRFYADCIDEIRREDHNHLILLEGNTYARDFRMFEQNLDDNLAYTFHYYPFLQLPDKLAAPNFEALLKQSLFEDVTMTHLREHLKRPLLCGETGHPLHLPSSTEVTAIFLELLESMQISWALWPLKDARAMGLCYPRQNAPYLKIVKEASGGWCFWDSFNQDNILASQGSADRHAFYRALAVNSTDAHRRFASALQRIPLETLLETLDDFHFDRCEINRPLLDCVERITK